ncbi:MAG: DUF2066 domain-containing protein [Hyphomicrobium sp.]
MQRRREMLALERGSYVTISARTITAGTNSRDMAGMLLCLAAAIAVAGHAAPVTAAPAADAVYTVANYPVEARAKDAVTAKDRAMTDGQQAALRSLLKRIVPVTAYDRLKRLKGVKAVDLIDGVSVRSESNSSTEYIANLDFTFQPDGVRTILRREGVPFIDQQAPKVVLVPAVREGAATASAAAAWTASWKGLDLVNTLTPARLEALKPEIHADTLKMLIDGGGGADRVLTAEYKADLVVVAIADLDAAAKRLTVTLVGQDAVGPINWKRVYRMAPGDHAYTMELAAVVGLGVLEGRWKATQASHRGGLDQISGRGAPVRIRVEFSSLGEWNEMRGHLLDTRNVEDVRIDGVSARSAEVALHYPGGAEQLVDAMATKGLALKSEAGGWVLRGRF